MIRIQEVIVATDFSDPAAIALDYGRNFARAFEATLHVIHVANDLATAAPVSEIPMDLSKLQAQIDAEAQEALDALVTDDDRQTLRVKTVLLTSSTPARSSRRPATFEPPLPDARVAACGSSPPSPGAGLRGTRS